MFKKVCLFCFIYLSQHSNAVDTNKESRDLVVMATPSIWDVNYNRNFKEIIDFQISLANEILKHENVIVLSDKHTMPYVDGRTHKIKGKLPVDVLLEADIYDIQLKDFAPMGIRELAKFPYSNAAIDSMASHQIEESMTRFLKHTNMRIDRQEKQLHVNGADVVDNGVSRAVINEQVVANNLDNLPDWAVLVKLLAVFKQAPLDEEERDHIEYTLRRKFYNDINILDHPMVPDSMMDSQSNCGLYTTLLTTDRNIYVPVFGNDPDNWAQGHSTITDKMVIQMLKVSTRKRVVPINVPNSICNQGLGLRSLTWTLRGMQAKNLVEAARWSGRRRFLRLLTLKS